MGSDVKRYKVFSIQPGKPGARTVWVNAGSARMNGDGTLSVELNSLPIDGKLQLLPEDRIGTPCPILGTRGEKCTLAFRHAGQCVLESVADAEVRR